MHWDMLIGDAARSSRAGFVMKPISVSLSFFIISLIALIAVQSRALPSQSEKQRDMAAIEKLHQADIAATLASDPDKLAALWASNGVLLGQGEAPVAGRQALRNAYATDATRVLRYKPRIQDIQIEGRIAYEWGSFDAAFQEKRDLPKIFTDDFFA